MPGLSDRIETSRFYAPEDDRLAGILNDVGVFMPEDYSGRLNASAKGSLLIYLIAEEGMSIKEVESLETLPREKALAIGKRYIAAMEAHPVNANDLSRLEIEENAAWHGRLMAKAVEEITKTNVKLPLAADLSVPEKSNEILSGELGMPFYYFHLSW